ncbi:hypothetical protein Emed_007581 [Eimeria media]
MLLPLLLSSSQVAVCHSRGGGAPPSASAPASAIEAAAAIAATAAAPAAGSSGRRFLRGGGTSEIASCSYAARAQGVEKGMWVHTAVSRCPSLVLLPYDFEGIEKACEGLFRAVLSLSHRLAPLSCDEHTVPHKYLAASPVAVKQLQQQQQQGELTCVGVTQTFVEICFPLVSQAERGPDPSSKSSSSSDSNSSSSGSSSLKSSNSSTNSEGSSKCETEIVADVCTSLREAVLELTGCSVSIGAGSNCLLAKVATTAAKPDASAASRFPPAAAAAVIRREGVCVVRPGAAHAAEFMGPLLLRRLPGVGRSAAERIAAAKKTAGAAGAAKTCTDVQKKRKDALQLLQAALGRKRGAQLWWLCHGVDVRPLPPPLPTVAAAAAAGAGSAAAAAAAAAAGNVPASGSLSISVNWGIRIQNEADLLNLLRQIAQEGSKRLTANRLYAAKLTLKVLYRAPGTSVNTTKFLGCGLCDSVRGTRIVGGNSSSSSSSSRAGGVSFGVQSTEDLYGELKALWRESLSDACPLEDYRGINLALQQLRTEQQEEALRRQQMQMQLRFSGGAHKPASISSSSSSHSSSSHSSSKATEPSLIVIDPTQPAEAELQQQPQQHEQQQAQRQQQETKGQQQSEHDEPREKAEGLPSFECCLLAASSSGKSGGSSSSGADSSSSETKDVQVFSPKTPKRPFSASQIPSQQQLPITHLSAGAAAGVSSMQQSSRGRLQIPQKSDVKTPERRTPLHSQEQQQQQQLGVRTPKSEAATPLLKTPRLDDSSRWARGDGVTPKINSSKWKARSAGSAKKSALTASAAAAAAAAGNSPTPTQRLLEDFLPSSNTGSPYTPIRLDPKQSLRKEKRQLGRRKVGVAAAAAASPKVISLLTQHPSHPDCSRSSRSSSASSCAERRSPRSSPRSLGLRQQQPKQQQQPQEDCCCGAVDVSKCCCSSEACTSQCMQLLCPPPAAFPREPPSLRAVSAAWRVLLLLLLHAAASGAAAAKRSGSQALVAAVVAARIANAANSSSGADHTAEQQHAAAAVAAIEPRNSSGSSLQGSACSSSDSAAKAAEPAAAAEAVGTSDGAASSARPSSPGPPCSGGPPLVTPAQEAEAEGFYWECVAEVLEGFGSALRKVAAALAAVGAFEERQVLLRFFLRTLESVEARTAAADAAAADAAAADAAAADAAAADAAAAATAAATTAAAADVKGAADGDLHQNSSSVCLSRLLLRLLVCPAGRLVWPLLLQRVHDAICFDDRSIIVRT